jgi:hypothetical protein
MLFTTALLYILKVGIVIPQTLFFLFSVALAIWNF